jgi:hypothetical protein
MIEQTEMQRMIVAPLQAAAEAFAAGELSELGLIAVSLAVNEELRANQHEASAAAFRSFSLKADEALMARADEINKGTE